MLATRYGIYSAKCHTTTESGGAVLLGGITSQRLNLTNEVSAETTGGGLSPQQVNLRSVQFGGQLSTRQAGAWLNLIGQRSKVIDSGVSNPGLVLYGQQHEQGSTRKTGSNHTSYTIKQGAFYPMTLSCNHGDDAELTTGLMATYDGTNNPIIVSHADALATAGNDDERYGLGPISIGGITFTGHKGLSIDFGNKVEADSTDGDIFPTMCSVLESVPTISLQGVNPQWFGASAIPLGGVCATHANTKLYLRRRSRCASLGYAADDAGTHIAITACGLLTLETVLDGSGTGRLQTNAKMQLADDGTNLPLVFDFAADLP